MKHNKNLDVKKDFREDLSRNWAEMARSITLHPYLDSEYSKWETRIEKWKIDAVTNYTQELTSTLEAYCQQVKESRPPLSGKPCYPFQPGDWVLIKVFMRQYVLSP